MRRPPRLPPAEYGRSVRGWAGSVPPGPGGTKLYGRRRTWGSRRAAVFGRRFDCGFDQLEAELAAGAHRVVVALISLHNALHQVVAHHIALVKLHEADAFHAAQHL